MQTPLTLYSLFQSFLGSAYLRNKAFVEETVSDHSSGAKSSIQLNTLSQSQKDIHTSLVMPHEVLLRLWTETVELPLKFIRVQVPASLGSSKYPL